jgi:hypothetical protein
MPAIQPPAIQKSTRMPGVDDVQRQHCAAVVVAELLLPARRSPTVDDGALKLVSTSIPRVVERLPLECIRGRHPISRSLFDLEETT